MLLIEKNNRILIEEAFNNSLKNKNFAPALIKN
ncbi:hypothetical protein BACCIP111895_02546 [Neobacillus rhizosphaerae]|uniref:Uncharacterized protein n=1 Tax=Neobacillus rhizosphaerae TaxID=2880965 RepID=A0ABN8KSD3_9BACI|nr:hypothetical protein BACCIP111895_02546 [Neobacillus rhizosphaerae]